VKSPIRGLLSIFATISPSIMFDENDLLKEIKFRTSRSSGKGGQNVNKVASKAELIFDVEASQLFSEE
jgi:ribosome-associated protein